MLPVSKLLLITPVILMASINSSDNKALKITSFEVIEESSGIKLKGIYKAIEKVSSGAYLILKMDIKSETKEIKKTFLLDMTQDGEIISDIIPYTSIIDIATFSFTIEPVLSKYSKDTETIKYNPSQNASKYLIMSERNNNIPLSTNYYKENFNIEESKIKHLYQSFTTLNYEDTKINDIYQSFDISFLNFKYENGDDNVLNGEFYFSFYDSYDLYKNFPARTGSMFKTIPLTLDRTNNIYSPSFNHDLYYEPNTHFMSYTPVEGYIKTNLLYFPISYADKLKEIRCQLSFNISDVFSFNVSGEFKISYIKKYFGECSDSEYCVISQEDTNDNVYEKVVDIKL